MHYRHLTRPELHRLLVARGQTSPDEPGTEVWPSTDSILTIALGLDRCQDEHNRERYFVTMLDDEHRPALRNHPDFALPGPISQAVVDEPIGGREFAGNFLLGPVRWLCRRLAQLPRVLAWPQDRIRADS